MYNCTERSVAQLLLLFRFESNGSPLCGRREKEEEGVESENAIAFFLFPPKQIREIAVSPRHSMTKPCFHGKKVFWTTDDAFPRKKIKRMVAIKKAFISTRHFWVGGKPTDIVERAKWGLSAQIWRLWRFLFLAHSREKER